MSGNHMIDRNELGTTAAVQKLLEQERAKMKPEHDPMPLALVLQFYGGDGTKEHPGDKPAALALARLLADVEPSRRDDVLFIFARQVDTPMDEEIKEAGMYVGSKMPVMHYQCGVQSGKGYPGECFDIWANTVGMLSDAYHTGSLPYHSAFMFEADGCPMTTDWIDRLKKAHSETLLLGKRVTGPVMRYPNYHVNGTMAIHLSLWEDRPSLHRCPPTVGWDCFHGLVMRAEANQHSQIIRNEYGMAGMSESVWWTIGREAAWLTSVKDGLHQHWARKNLVKAVDPWRNARFLHPRPAGEM